MHFQVFGLSCLSTTWLCVTQSYNNNNDDDDNNNSNNRETVNVEYACSSCTSCDRLPWICPKVLGNKPSDYFEHLQWIANF